MEIREYLPSERRTGVSSTTRKTERKRKRNDDIKRNIPEGSSNGFVSVANLLIKGDTHIKRRKTLPTKHFDEAGEDDDVDREIESGIIAVAPRKAQSACESSTKSNNKAKSRKSATISPKEDKLIEAEIMKRERSRESTPFSEMGIDDEFELELEKALLPTSIHLSSVPAPLRRTKYAPENLKINSHILNSSRSPVGPRVIKSSQLPGATAEFNFEVLKAVQLTEGPSPINYAKVQSTSSWVGETNLAWLLSEDDNPDIEIMNSSPTSLISRSLWPPENDSTDFSGHITSYQPTSSSSKKSPSNFSREHPLKPSTQRSSLMSSNSHRASMPFKSHSSKAQNKPSSPRISIDNSITLENDDIEFTQPIHRPGTRRARAHQMVDSPVMSTPSVAQRRLRRKHTEEDVSTERQSPTVTLREKKLSRKGTGGDKIARQKDGKKHSLIPRKYNPLLDLAASHSGEEVSEGESSSDGIESESDRQFLQELPATQASPSYQQTQIYRQSLLTQVTGGSGPAFLNRPVRQGIFGQNFRLSTRRENILSRSPTPETEAELDEYEFGSFIVNDDAETSYFNESSS